MHESETMKLYKPSYLNNTDDQLIITKSWFYPLIVEFQQKLKEMGLFHRFTIYYSDSWFHTTSTKDIAIPYYLHNYQLAYNHFKENQLVEGWGKREFIKYLSHEYGHLLESIYSTKKMKLRKQVFSSKKNYPHFYYTNPKSNLYSNLYLNYSTAHGDEAFAEAFSIVFLKKEKNVINQIQLQQIETVKSIIEICKTKKARKLKSEKLDQIFSISNSKKRNLSLLQFKILNDSFMKKWNIQCKYTKKEVSQRLFHSLKRHSKISFTEASMLPSIVNLRKQLKNHRLKIYL